MFLKQEEMELLLETIICIALMYTWYSSEFFRQQDGVFVRLNHYKPVYVFMIMKKHVTQWNTDVFLIVSAQQWSSIARRNKSS